MKDEIVQRLDRIAYKVSIPFCYSCYREVRSEKCAACGSDDLMRLLPGNGCEYGTDWVIRNLVSQIDTLDADERFESVMSECYPEKTKIGWIEYDTVSALKELDPVSWDLAKSEWLDQEEQEDLIMSFDHGYSFHDVSDVINFCEAKECELGLETEIMA